MWRGSTIVVTLSMFIAWSAQANQREQTLLEHDTYITLPQESAAPLFRLYAEPQEELYEELTRYLYAPISSKRRGVESWQWEHISESLFDQQQIAPIATGRVARLSTSNVGYRLGAFLSWGGTLGNDYNYLFEVVARTGRDANIEGVFQNRLAPRLTLIKSFNDSHRLSVCLELPYSMQGLRTSANEECYNLIGNNLYNPSWGYYHGEVRNSRVMRRFLPTLRAEWCGTISQDTDITITLDGEYGTRRLSRLGWYNTYNPTPNYYYKLPSYHLGTPTYSEAVEVWQQNNTDYTQIGWDYLEEVNLASQDGSTHYVVEDMVTKVAQAELCALFTTPLSGGFTITYGLRCAVNNNRSYKEMRDLLGGEYLLDIDQWSGDYIQMGNSMQNNLRSPNRKITNGDKFGYDYSLEHLSFEGLTQLEYHTPRLALNFALSLGEEQQQRVGHYEKERFAGSASYGESQRLSFSTYDISLEAGYIVSPKHHISIGANTSNLAPLSRNTFLAVQYCNYTISSPTTETLTSLHARYNYTSHPIRLSIEGYIISSNNAVQVWQGYDDISSTYCNTVISDIATRTMGLELAFETQPTYRLTLSASLAAGLYRYTSSPTVSLYSDVDMTLVSESKASSVNGYVVGNAPQLSTTATMRYRFQRDVTLSVELFYYAWRYAAPSLIRRTDRIVNAMTSPESQAAIINQERLPNLTNAHLSISKSFMLKDKSRIIAHLKVGNLLGGDNIISSAKEANRVIDGTTRQASTYEYAVGRTLYLSLAYRF